MPPQDSLGRDVEQALADYHHQTQTAPASTWIKEEMRVLFGADERPPQLQRHTSQIVCRQRVRRLHYLLGAGRIEQARREGFKV